MDERLGKNDRKLSTLCDVIGKKKMIEIYLWWNVCAGLYKIWITVVLRKEKTPNQ